MTDLIKKNCPQEIEEILSRLKNAGFHAYAVGGCIRDTLLGETPHDWDVTTSALPEEVLSVFRSEHTIPTGLKHGTVTVMKNHSPIEITTFRIDGSYSDSRHPESVTFSDHISDDLSRRDFTINALAWNEENGVVDCFGGLSDLKNGIIRAVGEPKKRFGEDALRILRAYRFSARLGFEIEGDTREAMISEAHRLKNISRERVSSEFTRLIVAKDALTALKMMEADGIFPYIFDGGTYTLPRAEILSKLQLLPQAFEDRIGFLLREAPSEYFSKWIADLRLSNKQTSEISILADRDRRIQASASEYEARRILSHYGDLTERALHIASLYGVNIGETANFVKSARENCDCITIGSLAIGGKDLIAEGIASGARIGSILAFLLDEVLHEPQKNTREQLLELARRL